MGHSTPGFHAAAALASELSDLAHCPEPKVLKYRGECDLGSAEVLEKILRELYDLRPSHARRAICAALVVVHFFAEGKGEAAERAAAEDQP